MIRILTDQNFDGGIIRGLSIRIPDLDLIGTEDHGLKHFADPRILAWAANNDRVVLTHDRKTFDIFAYQRIERCEKMCGVVVVPARLSIRQAIDELMILIQCQTDNEWENRIFWLPL